MLALQAGGHLSMALDPTADRPLSLQLADALRREIREGTRPPGSQLPSESEFQEGYGVSRTTARAALQQLVNEGLVVTRKGYGSYVRERPPVRRISSNRRHATHRASGRPIFDTEVDAQGQVPSRRMLRVGRTEHNDDRNHRPAGEDPSNHPTDPEDPVGLSALDVDLLGAVGVEQHSDLLADPRDKDAATVALRDDGTARPPELHHWVWA
jgi:DNA-binding transcriptional regulator YhcF (GntR family)